MDKNQQAVHRAEEAKRIVESPLYEQAWSEVRKALLESWASLPTSEKEAARDLHRMVKVLDKVKTVFDAHITSGKIAQKAIEAIAKPDILNRWQNSLNRWK